ncbi:enolase-phosphatase E1-like protein [Dinothrombium tinctorium]|uniref:Enolase-phosphatase E1-like protein n=1 Tax=Dinothrombium tinctorium TaxID=1965070 RepID=A0A443QPK9_9ACAR|nr:enolase-phosphatase E1-like protein [Dinothrombium tinctorium]
MSTLKLPRPEAVVMDLTGVIATSTFMAYSDENKQFVRTNIERYFQENFPKQKSLRLDVQFFKRQELTDEQQNKNQSCPKFSARWRTIGKAEIPNIVKHILWKIENDFSSPPVAYFMYHITEWGYKMELLHTPIYDEIPTVFEKWKALNIELYVAVASQNFANMVLSSTNHGNIISYFSGHVDLMAFENNNLVKIFDRLPQMLQKEAKRILFITRFPLDARCALKNKIASVLVIREDFDPLVKKKLETVRKEEKQGKIKKKVEIKSENESRQVESLILESGLIDINSTLGKQGKAEKQKEEESLTAEEIGSTILLFESADLISRTKLEVRSTDSKVVVDDILKKKQIKIKGEHEVDQHEQHSKHKLETDKSAFDKGSCFEIQKGAAIEEEEQHLTKEEIGSTILIFESRDSLSGSKFEARETSSKVITDDIRELNVVENLSDIAFE